MIISPDIENAALNNGIYMFTWDHHALATRSAYYKFYKELHKHTYKKVYVLMGLPGSGKSTWAREHDNQDTLIWDSTNLDRVKRIIFFAAIAAAGYEVNLVYVKTPLSTCIERQQAREPNRQCPAYNIELMHDGTFEPDKHLEGLHSLLIVE